MDGIPPNFLPNIYPLGWLPGFSKVFQYKTERRQQNSTDFHRAKKRKPSAMRTHYESPVMEKYLKIIPLKSEPLYFSILDHKMSKKMMQEYGYPIPDDECPGKVTLFSNSMFSKPNNPSVQICRCGKQVSLLEANWFADDAGCNYHLGKRVYCDGPQNGRFTCCSSSGPPCAHGMHHVSFHRPFQDIEFVRVSPEKRGHRHPSNVYALDCEMAFTTRGMELVRVSLVGVGGVVLYDSYVRPQHPILDYNTPFSGVQERDLSETTTTLSDVHNNLLNFLNADTILVGHSLENDLLALNLVHEKVVDTSCLFPHERGYPFKYSLKNLAAMHLGRSIQEGFVGHDSVEDAVTCLELLLYKVYKDLMKATKEFVKSPPPQLVMPPPVVILEGQWMVVQCCNVCAPTQNGAGCNVCAPNQNGAGCNGCAPTQIGAGCKGNNTTQNCTSSNRKAVAQNFACSTVKTIYQNTNGRNGNVSPQKVASINGKANSQNTAFNGGNATAQNSAALSGAALQVANNNYNANATAINSAIDSRSGTSTAYNGKGISKITVSSYKNALGKNTSMSQMVKAEGNSPSVSNNPCCSIKSIGQQHSLLLDSNKETAPKNSNDEANAITKREWKVLDSSNRKVFVKNDANNNQYAAPINSTDVPNVELRNPWVILPINNGNLAVRNSPSNRFMRPPPCPPPRPYYGAFKPPCPPTFFNGPVCPPVWPFFSAGFFVPNSLIRWC